MYSKFFKTISLALVLIIALSACHTTTPQSVGTVGETDISAGIYLMYQFNAYSRAVNLLEDANDDVFTATIEDKTGEQYINDELLLSLQRYAWIEQNSPEDLFTDEEIASTSQSAAFNYSYLAETYSANGIGEQTYVDYYLIETKFERLLSEYTEQESENISDEQAMDYMNETYKKISTLTFPDAKADGTALSDEELAQIQGVAEDLVDDLKTGTMDEEGREALDAAAEIAGIEITDELVSQYITSNFVTSESVELYYSADDAEQILAASEGDSMLSSTQSPIAVYHFVPNFEDEEEFTTTYRDSIVSEIAFDNFSALIDEESAQFEIALDESARNTYSAKNIV